MVSGTEGTILVVTKLEKGNSALNQLFFFYVRPIISDSWTNSIL
jgi:hypothetical protein